MARCGCGGGSCNCFVEAGTGTTVTGTGSSTNPFVVSADAPACSAVRPCISAGNGAAYNSASGVVSARPSTDPGNLVEFGGDGGLLVETDCPTVRACFSEGNGIDYDPTTGVIAARPSTDPGNTVTFGGDGGLYAAGGSVDCATVRGCISAGQGAAYVPATGVVSARISPAAGNLVEFAPDGGLFVETDCATVRTCFSEGNGVDYDPLTGVIAARPSTDPGNTVVFGGDGGLFVPAAAALVTDCGLTGTGAVGDPLAAAVGAWAFPCDLDANAGQVYCDSTGVLRSEPRGKTAFVQDQQILNFANVAVPAALDTEVATHQLNIVNPDACRAAFVMIEGEVDADFNLPANSGAALGIATDEMSYEFNNGTTTVLDVHTQGTKVVNGTIPAGGALLFTLSIRMGRGSGGATYNRIQSFVRAFVFVL